MLTPRQQQALFKKSQADSVRKQKQADKRRVQAEQRREREQAQAVSVKVALLKQQLVNEARKPPLQLIEDTLEVSVPQPQTPLLIIPSPKPQNLPVFQRPMPTGEVLTVHLVREDMPVFTDVPRRHLPAEVAELTAAEKRVRVQQFSSRVRLAHKPRASLNKTLEVMRRWLPKPFRRGRVKLSALV